MPMARSHLAVAIAAMAVMAIVAGVLVVTMGQTGDDEVTTLLTYDEKNRGFPVWSHATLPPVDDRSAVNGRWNPKSASPPYVQPLTIYSGEGVDTNPKSGPDEVRRVLGVKKSWRNHRWESNNFVASFESDQMRFLSRAKDSVLVVPPLYSMPVISTSAARLFNNFLLNGHNTVIVCGSASAVEFLNYDVISWDFHGYNLDAAWHAGPYEQQKATIGTRFEKAATMLPGDGVWGVSVESLPKEAVSYYEAPGVSVVFSLPSKSGEIIFVGYNFEQPNAAWSEVLEAAATITKTPAHTPVKPTIDHTRTAPAPAAPAKKGGKARNVVVVGVDGLKPDLIAKAPSHAAFDKMAATGAGTRTKARTVLQTFSAPAWSSILCGVPPEFSGVTSNTWVAPWVPKAVATQRRTAMAQSLLGRKLSADGVDEVPSWIGSKASAKAFELSLAQNLMNDASGSGSSKASLAAASQTPMSLLSSVDTPRHIDPYTGSTVPFPCIFESVKKQAPETQTHFYYSWDWLKTLGNRDMKRDGAGFVDDEFFCKGDEDMETGAKCDEAVVARFEADQKIRRGGGPQAAPFVTFIYLVNLDNTGHLKAWGSKEYLDYLGVVDKLLGRVMDAVDFDDTMVVVTSDHGGIEGTGYHAWGGQQSIVVPWYAKGPGVKQGHEVQKTFQNMGTMPTVLSALGLESEDGWIGQSLDDIFE